MGLLTRLVAPEEVEDCARALAGRLARQPRRATEIAKASIAAAFELAYERSYRTETEAMVSTQLSADARTAADAFARRSDRD